MHCPFCRHHDTKVLDSRVAEDGSLDPPPALLPACEQRFTTLELMQLTVVKRSGATEAFDRDKAIAGVRKACKGRPVTEDDLARLGQPVEDALRGSGQAEFAAHEVGMAILEPLRELDEVAYLRFAARLQAVRVRRGLRDRDRQPAQAPRRAALGHPRQQVGRPDLSPQRLTTDRPVRRGEAAYRATHSGTSLRPCGVSVPPARLKSRDHNTRDQETQHDRDGERGRPQEGRPPRVCRSRGGSAPRACTPTTRSPGSAATSSRPTGRPARPSSSSAASSSPTSGRSTPRPSSPRSTSAAPSAPTSARPACAS